MGARPPVPNGAEGCRRVSNSTVFFWMRLKVALAQLSEYQKTQKTPAENQLAGGVSQKSCAQNTREVATSGKFLSRHTSDVGKNLSLLKLAQFFFAQSHFSKSAALGNRPSQSFISSLAPEKNVNYFLKCAERCDLLRFQRWLFSTLTFFQRWLSSTLKFSTILFSTLNIFDV